MEDIKLINSKVYTMTWLPVGRSNMEALNRFVGAHKKYTTPTEFGIDGSISDMRIGAIDMNQHGIFLTPCEADMSSFLKANLKSAIDDENELGFSMYKTGLTSLGVAIDKKLSLDEAKIISGKLNDSFSRYVFPLLTGVQQSLVSELYLEDSISQIRHKLHSYSVLCCDIEGSNFVSSGEFLEKHPGFIDSYTDWIISHSTMYACHIFIGMAGCVCIGKPNNQVKELLKYISYQKTCHKITQRLHSLLWSLRRQIQQIRNEIKESNYRILKVNNEKICELNDALAKVKVFDQMLRSETIDLHNEISELPDILGNDFGLELIREFKYEIEKSENREITIEQLQEELKSLGLELENKLELIMTRDSMQLNMILLFLTVLSVLGVAEVLDFTQEQWEVVGVFLVMAVFFVIYYLKKLITNYPIRRKKKKTVI